MSIASVHLPTVSVEDLLADNSVKLHIACSTLRIRSGRLSSIASFYKRSLESITVRYLQMSHQPRQGGKSMPLIEALVGLSHRLQRLHHVDDIIDAAFLHSFKKVVNYHMLKEISGDN